MIKTTSIILVFVGLFQLNTFGQTITKKDTKDFSYALLDGTNVTLYADLALLRKPPVYEKNGIRIHVPKATAIMHSLWENEKNFRFGQTWMVKEQLRKLMNDMGDPSPNKLNDIEIIVYSRLLNDYAIVHHHLGYLTIAKNFHEKALKIREDRLGKNHLATISSYNNLAALHRDLGEYTEGLKLFEKALDLLAKLEMTNSIEYAISLNNLSTLESMLGRNKKAYSDISKAIKIAEPILRNKSKDFLSFLLNKSLISKNIENYKEAESILLNIKELKEKRFGKKSSQYARTLLNLAGVYFETEEYHNVSPLLKKAEEIYLKKFGKNHPVSASILLYRAQLARKQQDYTSALKLSDEAIVYQKRLLGIYHTDRLKLIELKALCYWETGKISDANIEFQKLSEIILQIVSEYFPVMTESQKTSFWLDSKDFLSKYYSFIVANYSTNESLILDLFKLNNQTKGMLLDESIAFKRKIFSTNNSDIISSYTDLNKLKAKLIRFESLDRATAIKTGIKAYSIKNKIKALEQTLNSAISKIGLDTLPNSLPDYENILSDQKAFIDIIRFQKFDKALTNEVKYVGIILQKGVKPKLIEFNDGNDLETKAYSYYKNCITYKLEDIKSYDKYWKPLEDELKNIETVYLSVDGIFNQININTIPTSSPTNFVLDKYQLTLVSNFKEIIEISNTLKIKGAFLLGNPDFNSSTISQLPGAQKEIEIISELLKQKEINTDEFNGKDAKEASVRFYVPNHEILHFSTHGYFLPDEKKSTQDNIGDKFNTVNNNPLLRSGLILANPKNDPINGKTDISNSGTDGLLSALEVLELDLDATDLVILSACETGLGDIQAGEGVYGLQRSFQIAGAKTIICSLWKVNDEATQKLMKYFYEELFISNNKLTAFSTAQKRLKKDYPLPYYWGAFVCIN